MSDTHTISMAYSELNWDDIDKRARNIGFKDRSKYIQYLAEKDIGYSRIKKIGKYIVRLFEIVLLIEVSALLIILTLL